MTRPRKSSAMLERARQYTLDGRERAAGAMLEWAKVEAAIRESAGKGMAQVTLVPAAPVDVKGTPLATATESRLQNLGFATRWDERAGPEPGTRFHTFIVSWGS